MDSRSAPDETPGPPGPSNASAPPNRPELSEREREILILVATGASNKLIAQQLVISPNTVKVHVRNIFAKIGVASRTEAALFAIREGLVQINGELPQVAADDPATADEAPTPEPALAAETPAPPVPAPNAPARRWLWALGVLLLAVLVVAGGVYVLRPTTPPPTPTAIVPTAIPRWAALANLPTARAGLAVVTYENQIYAIGGETAAGVSGQVERFDPATGTWDSLTAKPLAVSDVSAAVIGGQIYVPGGRLASGALSDALAVYHPSEDRWDTRAALPMPVSGYALVAFEGQLYLFGGWDGNKYLDQALAYNPGQDAWRELPAMPTARAFAGAAVAGGLIYVVGGEGGAGPLNVNEVFLPTREAESPAAWETRQPLPEARTRLGLTSLADSVYAVGGEGAATQFGGWAYQAAQDAWRPLDLPGTPATTRFGLTALQTHLYAIGGEQGATPSGQHLSYQAIYTTIFPGVSGE